jgi:two-component system chemotaxis sensor kinase CheA
VQAKAVASGLLSEAAAAELTPDGIYDLLFTPGFSTAPTVTEISGRGVGLDVVRANVRRVGGDVVVRSDIGRFTSVEMRLPIRVSARDILLVQAADEWYAIPLDSVRKTMSISSKGVQSIRGTPTIASDEQLVPLLPLADLLGRAHHRSMPSRLEVVVLASRGQPGALLVDAIGQRHQVTVKALDSYLATDGIGGATVLADGRVVLVLDPEPLLEAVAHTGR